MAYTPHPTAARRRRAAGILRRLKTVFPAAKIMLTYRTPWELLVAVQLSAQCTDKKVNEVTPRLFRKYRTLDDYVRAKPREFEHDIHATGFYRNKTKNILAAAKAIRSKFKGNVPRTMSQMLTIPGMGRKSANVVLGNAFGVVEGIAVDTHVLRLSRVLGLSDHRDPEKIEKDLMALYPKSEWFALTYRLITYGRTYCTAKTKDHTHEPLVAWHIR